MLSVTSGMIRDVEKITDLFEVRDANGDEYLSGTYGQVIYYVVPNRFANDSNGAAPYRLYRREVKVKRRVPNTGAKAKK